jgi:hypothetical protein
MGSSPKAILAYGFDLGRIADHFEWDYDGDEETGGPPWFDGAADSDMATGARLALLAANGVDLSGYDAMTMAEQDEVMRALGIYLVGHGGEEGDETLILAAKVHTTDWNWPVSLSAADLYVPEGINERLTWALGVLGITSAADAPGWLLAADYG